MIRDLRKLNRGGYGLQTIEMMKGCALESKAFLLH